MLENYDKTEFNILTSQAINLTQADCFASSTANRQEIFEFWFQFLLEKRNDQSLQKRFLEARKPKLTPKQQIAADNLLLKKKWHRPVKPTPTNAEIKGNQDADADFGGEETNQE